MSAFFYGYCACQIPGAVAVRRYGARAVLAICITMWSVLTAATPLAARHGPHALVAVRMLLGVAEAPVGPASTHVIAHWAPAHERSRGQAVQGFGESLSSIVFNRVFGGASRFFARRAVFQPPPSSCQ